MSVVKFELKEEHLKLIRGLRFRMDDDNNITCADMLSPFGGDNIYEDMNVILYGKPDDFDPMKLPDELAQDTVEQLSNLYSELPNALEIVLTLNTFETGWYKRKWHDRSGWKRLLK
jgi:hypothetical protein